MEAVIDLTLLIITIIFLIAAGASTFFMIFPSLGFMFILTFIYALINHFQRISPVEIAVLAGIAILAELIDYIAGFIGAKIGGAKVKSLIFGVIGLIFGLIIYPPFGGVIGLFMGIIFAEIIFHKDLTRAIKAGVGGVLGTIAGTLIKAILALVFLILFLVFVF